MELCGLSGLFGLKLCGLSGWKLCGLSVEKSAILWIPDVIYRPGGGRADIDGARINVPLPRS